MDFLPDAAQRKLIADVAAFATAEIAPGADDRDREARFSRELWRRLGKEGLTGLLVPTEYGGRDLDFLTTAMVLECLSRHGRDMGLCISLTITTLLGRFQFMRHANERQKKKYLPAIASGEIIPAFAVSEREHGSHPRYLQTTAERDGADYIINGRKMYITNGPVADAVIVFAVTEKISDRNGISAFIVEKGMPGFSVGEIMDLPFCRSSPHCELVFESVRVPEENLFGEPSTAFDKMVRSVRETEDALGMAGIVGLLDLQLELATKYLDGCEPEPSDEQLLLLADFASMIDALRMAAYRAAWLRDKQKTGSVEYGLCHTQFQRLTDLAAEMPGKLFPNQEDVIASGLERPLRDMGISKIGRNVAKARTLRLGRKLAESKEASNLQSASPPRR